MMKKPTLYGILVLVALTITLLLAFLPAQDTVGYQKVTLAKASLTEVREHYLAGEEIRLAVTVVIIDTINTEHKSYPLQLYISSSYGNSLLDVTSKKGVLFFQLPSIFSNKSGIVQWKLLHAGNVLDTGTFTILPNTKGDIVVESYVGPPSIVAGGQDYTMLVTAATDTYDNLIPNDSEVRLKHFYNENAITSQLISEDRIVWKRIFSSETTGKITLAASVNDNASKELIVEVLPNNPVNFTIEENRIHPYADGNQIVTLTTSKIYDSYDNVVADGTLVVFNITNTEGTISRTSGTTLNGIATGRLLHPDIPTQWEVNATIDGMAQSDLLTLEFKPILLEFNVQFSENNKIITVGPLTSFLGQLIPDGVEVTLTQNELNNKQTKTSLNGVVIFVIPENNSDLFNTNITVEALGVSQTFTKSQE